MSKTKPYITLRDRTWKGKEWFTSFGSQKNIRKLTDKEAEPLLKEGSIEEIELPKYDKDIVGDNNGRMFCKKCNGNTGFYIKKRPFGKKVNVYICADCGIREVKEIK